MLLDCRMCSQSLKLWLEAFIYQEHLQLLRGGERLAGPSIDQHTLTFRCEILALSRALGSLAALDFEGASLVRRLS